MKKVIITLYSIIVVFVLVATFGWAAYYIANQHKVNAENNANRVPGLVREVSSIMNRSDSFHDRIFGEKTKELFAENQDIQALTIYSYDTGIEYFYSKNGKVAAQNPKADSTNRHPSYKGLTLSHNLITIPLTLKDRPGTNMDVIFTVIPRMSVFHALQISLLVVIILFAFTLVLIIVFSLSRKKEQSQENWNREDSFKDRPDTPPVPSESFHDDMSLKGDMDFGTPDRESRKLDDDWNQDAAVNLDNEESFDDDFSLDDELNLDDKSELDGELSFDDDLDLEHESGVDDKRNMDDEPSFDDEFSLEDNGLDMGDELNLEKPDRDEALNFEEDASEPDELLNLGDEEEFALEELDFTEKTDLNDDLSLEAENLDMEDDLNPEEEADRDGGLNPEKDESEVSEQNLEDEEPSWETEFDLEDDLPLEAEPSSEEETNPDEDLDLDGKLDLGDNFNLEDGPEDKTPNFEEESEIDELNLGEDILNLTEESNSEEALPMEEELDLGNEADLDEELDLTDTLDLSDDLDMEEDLSLEEDFTLQDASFEEHNDVPPELEVPKTGESLAPTLYNPETGLGWGDFLEERLGLELERSASFDQDLVLLIIRYNKNQKKIADSIKEFYNYQDLIFEAGENSLAIIDPNKDLDQAIDDVQDLFKKLSRESDTGNLGCGLSSRNGRLITGKRLIHEAENSLDKADSGSPIVGFRSDPERFREYLNSK